METIKDEQQFTPEMRFAAILSIVVSLFLFVCKFVAYRMTHSQAIFSDAMESIVNIVTAFVAFGVLLYAAKPADDDHPYGHGKVEYMSAGLEGGLIAFAAIMIGIEAIQAFYDRPALQSLNVGLALITFAGIINLLLGLYLKRVGRKKHSLALEASGKHLLADFWTSAGVIFGLFIVYVFEVWWLDPVVALLVCLHLFREGFELIRKSIAGLLDEEQLGVIERIRELIADNHRKGIIQIHHLRVMRSGRYHHIDAHVVVPEFWSVEEAHDETREYEKTLFQQYEFNGEIHFHIDPCRRLYCRFCDYPECPVRKEEFKHLRNISVAELKNPDEPSEIVETQ